MEQLYSYVTDRMINYDIISVDDKEYYAYSIQVLAERIICLLLITLAALIFNALLEVSFFILVYALIRKNCDGFHCRTSVGCFCASTVMSLSTILIGNILTGHCTLCLGVVLLSMVVLCIIATFNNPQMSFTEEELNHLRRNARITVLIIGCVIIVLLFFLRDNKYISFMALGLIYNAFSVLIAIMIERRKKWHEVG